jgi:hypothetical protein
VEAKKDGKVAVPAKILIDTLKTFPEQPLTFTIDEKTRGVTIILPPPLETDKFYDVRKLKFQLSQSYKKCESRLFCGPCSSHERAGCNDHVDRRQLELLDEQRELESGAGSD